MALALARLTLFCALLLPAAEVVRSKRAIREFKQQTGYLQGRQGYVIDHIIPLCSCQGDKKCLGALDVPANMQWQEIPVAKEKDKREHSTCRAIRTALKVCATC
jgi:hypothetical protein